MAQINIRIDDDLKKQADGLFSELGMNTSTAVILFMKQAVREGGIPFKITRSTDAFYSTENISYLKKVIASSEEQTRIPIIKNLAQLEAMEKSETPS